MVNNYQPPPVPRLPAYGQSSANDNVRFTTDEERRNMEGKKDVEIARKVGIASMAGPILANPYLAIGAYALSKWDRLKTGKPQDQQSRDQVRDTLWDIGAVSSDWKLKFSDGGDFDIGKDGGARLKSTKGAERKYYEVDMDNPLSQAAMSSVSPIAALITNNDEKLRNEFMGYFTNAATQDVKDQRQMDARISEMYGMVGITKSAGLKSLQELQAQGRISDEQFKSYSAQVNKYAPDVDPRSPVDAFLPRGSYANKIAASAVAKMQAKMGVDFFPDSNIRDFTLSDRVYSDPAYVKAPTTQPNIVAKPQIVNTTP